MKAPRAALWVGLLCVAHVTPGRPEVAVTNWERNFPTRAAPENVYFKARYADARGRMHDLQVWRQGDLRLRRKTDEAINLYVEKNDDGEYLYRLVDHARRLLIRVDRSSLYRMGTFSDWAGLAHVLNAPRGEYTVTGLGTGVQLLAAGECTWMQLEIATPPGEASRICWSEAWGLPLEIRTRQGDKWALQFSIAEVRSFEPSVATFTIEKNDLIERDATSNGKLAD